MQRMPIDMILSKQRSYLAEELLDQEVPAGAFFGITCSKGGQVWHFDGTTAVRLGIPDPDPRSKVTLQNGQRLREALKSLPWLADEPFVLHRMALPPGAYYPRIARPIDQHANDSPGLLPDYWQAPDQLVGSLNQVRSLVGLLDSVFQTVHPVSANMACFGSAIRNLLILACTECEAQWRGVLIANGCAEPRTTADYIKLLPAMR